MNNLEFYHNKKCSKSRQALQYLTDKGYTSEQITLILYLENGLTEQQIQQIIDRLDEPIDHLLRIQDAKKMNIDIPEKMDIKWLKKQLVLTPQLMQRPIIVAEKKAIIARTTDKIDSLIN